MLRTLLVVLSAVALVATSLDARAVLVEGDLVSSGDGMITLDTATGLEWLDVTATTNMSALDVLASSFVTTDGFRYATTSEVCDFYSTHVVTLSVCPPVNFDVFAVDSTAVLHLLGVTQGTSVNNGIYADLDGGSFYGTTSHQAFGATTILFVSENGASVDFSHEEIGSLLVRQVPEPNALLLLLLVSAAFLILTVVRMYRSRDKRPPGHHKSRV